VNLEVNQAKGHQAHCPASNLCDCLTPIYEENLRLMGEVTRLMNQIRELDKQIIDLYRAQQ